MIPENLHICRFVRDGRSDMGEYMQLDDGTGLCHVPNSCGAGESFVVSYPDGTMPEGISDLELFEVPFSVDYDPFAKLGDSIPPEISERMAQTKLILEEYEAGTLDEREAGEALFNHLLGGGGMMPCKLS